MGCFDIYCMLSGTSADGGPRHLLDEWNEEGKDDFPDVLPKYLHEFAQKLVQRLDEKRIKHAPFHELPNVDELQSIITDTFRLLYKDPTPSYPVIFRPWCSEVAVFGCPEFGDYDTRAVLPVFEKVAYCSEYCGYGGWEKMLDEDGEWVEMKTGTAHTDNDIEPQCAFMDRRCWDYLQTWVDLPPLESPNREPRLDLEFWDVVKDGCTDCVAGIHPDIDYGVMQYNWEQFQTSAVTTFEEMCLEDVPYLTEAISLGLRGAELNLALCQDLQVWIYQTPDIWPRRSEGLNTPIFTRFEPAGPQNGPSIFALPRELVLTIFSDLSILDYLNVSSTSRAVRQVATHSSLFSAIVSDMVHHGSLRWLKPCPLVQGEIQKANEVLTTWLDDSSNVLDPLHDRKFPILAFVRTCFTRSTSMMSRRRLWGISKQFEKKWIVYRRGKMKEER
ncbi:hypothetical protein DL96DRAFT_1589387 [Flagelloscypha sp. PMI_526]|nr:hypothetical protein DL96DRAFT_1589387 [Flagelloscypha sp. PMI_526]